MMEIGSECLCSDASETWNFFSALLISAARAHTGMRAHGTPGPRETRRVSPRASAAPRSRVAGWAAPRACHGAQRARARGTNGRRGCLPALPRRAGGGWPRGTTRALAAHAREQHRELAGAVVRAGGAAPRTFLCLLHAVPRKELVDPPETQFLAVQLVVYPRRRRGMRPHPASAHTTWNPPLNKQPAQT